MKSRIVASFLTVLISTAVLLSVSAQMVGFNSSPSKPMQGPGSVGDQVGVFIDQSFNFDLGRSGFPRINTGYGGVDYSAMDGLLSVGGTELTVQLSAGSPIIDFFEGLFEIEILVSNTGELIGGVAGDDFVLSGDLDLDNDGIDDVTGVLLSGEIISYNGVDGQGGMLDMFFFSFELTGGALFDEFGGSSISVSITASFSSFDSTYDDDFKAGFVDGMIYGKQPVCTGAIGDYVWQDLNSNGIQDSGEPGIDGVDVTLTDSSGAVSTFTTITGGPNNAPGYYLFPMLCADTYVVAVDPTTVPLGFTPTIIMAPGSDPTNDSNDPDGKTVVLTTDDSEDLTCDFGYIVPTDIDIEKATNGVDADDANAGDAPQIAAGSIVTWTYVVTNTGSVTIENVLVTDDQGVAVSCPLTTLTPGQVMTCSASGLADDLNNTTFTTVPGLCGNFPNTPMYENMGQVTGTSTTGQFVEDIDPSHYCNPPEPAIDIEKATNGVDADDANAGDAPQIAAGSIVTWTYVVTNTGNVTIENVVVNDDQGVSVSCPLTTLTPGQVMTCTASGLADNLNSTAFTTVPGLCGSFPNTPMYENMGQVTGTSTTGQFVEDIDPSHYCNPPEPAIDIEKATNGVDADDANAGDAPQIAAGSVVTWTYVVTNTGNVTIENVVVNDDQGVSVSCPLTTLTPGQVMTCTASGLADNLNSTAFTTVPGLCGSFPNTPMYENMGQVTGTSTTGQFVEDIDPSHYCNPPEPAIDIEKATNGVDADDANAGDAPQIAAGSVVTWTYVVTNTGNVTIENVVVNDDQGVSVSCPLTTLTPGQVMTCTASGLADNLNSTAFTTVPGLCGSFPNTPMYENMGQVTGTSTTGQFVEDIDPSHYCNPPEPAIDIEKATNGVDADDPNAGDAPQIAPGSVVTWTYVVTNTGNVTLGNVVVVDDQGVPVICPMGILEPGESMTCTASGLADDLTSTIFTTVPGVCGSIPNTPLYENMGRATGLSTTGEFVEDQDPSHYCNPPTPAIDIEKATNGVDADDPNAGDAPQIAVGSLVTWTYVVTNTGSVTIENVVVTDDQGVAVSCPLTTLTPGQIMTCSASGLADDLNSTTFTTVPGLCGSFPSTPLYENMGRVTGTSTTGVFLEDIDPSHYCNPPEPAIDIEKATNGVDADDANAGDAPLIVPGGVVTWTYVVTNTGNSVLNNVSVIDDQGVTVTCPLTTLTPGQMMTCTATGIADDLGATVFTTVPGLCGGIPNVPLYQNMGQAVGTAPSGEFVEDIDASHYCNPQVPDIDIEKATNGVDADDPNAGDAPQVPVGGAITWLYVVTNTGDVTLFDVTVTDDRGVAVTCPMTTLTPMQSMDCTGFGAALDLDEVGAQTIPGLCGSFPNTPMYNNVGDVVGTSAIGETVTDEDPSHYCNPQVPGITIEKLTNGVDADDPNAGDAPTINPGDTVTWTYNVTNTGDVTLFNVAVVDDQGVVPTCPQTTLAPMETMTCTASATAVDVSDTTFTTVPGLCGGFPNTPLYENRGTATGETIAGDFVEDDDLSHYCNVPACDVGVEKTCLIPMMPASDYVCDTPIDSLTFIWDGSSAVRIKAYKGDVGSQQLADIDDIQPGEEITVMGYAGSPNDVYFEIFTAGTSNKIGESKFHLSCSDDEMDGPEDCGLNEGNGKGNDSGFVNDWLLEGIVDAGGTLDCTTDPGTTTNACEFQVFPASCETGDADFLTFAYTGGGCGASDNDQDDHVCSGNVDGSQSATFTDDDGNSVVLSPGETVTIPRNLAKNMTLSNSGGTETNVAHTSCSQPLQAGDVYGSLTLAQIDGQGVGTEVIYSYTITNNGAFNLVDLSALDVPLGPVPGLPGSLGAGQSVTSMTSAFIMETTTNTVIVDATDSQGATCSATANATVTILPPPPCEVNGEGVLELSSDKVKWNLTNAGAFNATIDSVEISWPSANGDIIEVKIDGDKIFDSSRSPTSTVFGPGDWINDPAKRVIPPGDTDTLEIKFDNDVVGPQMAYSITVNFEEGCSVTFENTGLPFVCTKPIDELTMIWDGAADPIRVKAWKGSVGSELLLDQSGITAGTEVVVSGYAGSPNDVFWEIFSGSTKIGESNFHMSCSDNDMNGAEDCGKRQGNGKSDDSNLINDWLLDGMVDNDGPFTCE